MNSHLPAGDAALVTEHAAAKINLALHITGQRDDGYHLLDTLVVFTQAGDTIRAAPSDEDRFTLSGRFASVLQADADNLVLRARGLIRQLRPELPPVALDLEKSLPVASGIGGGSADAAATLRALSGMLDAPLSEAEFSVAALSLGADVPMCLASHPLRVRGIGESLAPVRGLPVLHMVLVNPGMAVSTPTVFGSLLEKQNAPLPELPGNVAFSDLVDWLRQTRNDLQHPASIQVPQIGQAIAALDAAGAAFSRMSGSGATCFGLFSDTTAAQAAARSLASRSPTWYVKATQTI